MTYFYEWKLCCDCISFPGVLTGEDELEPLWWWECEECSETEPKGNSFKNGTFVP
jgi:hypothetical protein